MARSGTLAHGRPRGDIVTPGGSLRLWADTQTSVSGVATFHPTVDGTAGTPSLFSDILGVFPAGETNTGVLTDAPMASLRDVNADRTSIRVNVMTGTVLGLLGATLLPAPDGTPVRCLVVGT